MVNSVQRLRQALEELLAESVASARARESGAFERMLAPFGHRIVLFGAGNLGRRILGALRTSGIEPLAFVDNNAALWGSRVDGLAVHSPSDGAARWGRSATFVVAIWRGEGTETMTERCRPLIDLGCANVRHFGPLFWRYHELLLPHYSLDLPHKVLLAADAVRAGFDVWGDDASRAEYVAQVRWRLHLDFDALLPVDQDIYFPPGLFRLSEDEVFIDCGAYNGDTIRDLLDASGGRFRRVYAFEADGRNFLKLRQYIDSLPASLRERIKPIGKAVGERAEMLHFAATGTAAAAVVTGGSASSTGVDVPCVALDTEVAEPPTFIKMDIEGSELAALRGARRMIAGHAPILSICVYHTQDHLWAVPLQIAGVNPSYNLHLRPHLRESWDLVCYAVPAGRVPA